MSSTIKSSVIFPRRLKSAMFERGVSSKQLAEKSGLHENMIGHYVRGTYAPKLGNLELLCDALNVSADWLMGRTDEMEVKE